MHKRGNIIIRIRELRKARGLSQIAMARQCGLGVQAISHIETGKRHPNLETMAAIAYHMRVSIDSLLTYTGALCQSNRGKSPS